MLHLWTKATDGTGSAIRVVLFDYRKAFDLIDHNLLVRKVFSLSIPYSIACWVAEFLTHRQQRVKLSADCFSEWGPVPAGVPQGTKLGPWLFILMINDLNVSSAYSWKYIDDTTVAEIVPRNTQGNIEDAVNEVVVWSRKQNMQLNADKCKELIIDSKKNKHSFSPLTVDGYELSVVNSAKILGVTISNDLKWNAHVTESIKKCNKRLYFLILLKRAGVCRKDIVSFYCTVIRPVLDYCSPIFHHSLPESLSEDLERVQKRALSIISPEQSYSQCLVNFGLSTLRNRRNDQCTKLFNSMSSSQHCLSHLLPPKHNGPYNFHNNRLYELPLFRTNRFKHSFIPALCSQCFYSPSS